MNPVKISIDELRPCDACGKPIAPVFSIVTIQPACIKQDAHTIAGALQPMFGGSLPIAKALMPGGDDCVATSEKTTTRLFLCQDCVTTKEHNLAVLAALRVLNEREPEEELSDEH